MESLDRDTWCTRMHAGEKDGTSAFLGSSSMVGLKWFFYPENIP